MVKLSPLKSKEKTPNKNLLFFISLVISFILYVLIGYDSYINKESSHLESSYVLDDLNIEILYDEENYEVSAVLNKPYAVISGNSLDINKLKLSKSHNFFIDVNNLQPGNYDVYVEYKGISDNLKVEIYPMLTEVFIREKSIVDYTPVIEIEGNDILTKKDLIVGLPEIVGDIKNVRVRETQANFNLIGSIKGKVNVSKFVSDKTVDVELSVYDKKDKLMSNINLLDKSVSVKIPIEKKTTIVNEIIKEETIINNNLDELDKRTLEYKSLLEDYNLLESKLKKVEDENIVLNNNLKSFNSNVSRDERKSYETKINDLKNTISSLETDKENLLFEIEKLKLEINNNPNVDLNSNSSNSVAD